MIEILTINDVLLASEAAEMWGLKPGTIKDACDDSLKGKRKNAFLPGEYRKTKGGWLVTIPGMERVFGSKLNKEEYKNGKY